jgi:nucleotide-binding universal stress UspA family protein
MIELRRILVPMDGSSLAERALPLAKTLAWKHGSQLILLRAWRLFPPARGFWRGRGAYSAVEQYEYQAAKVYLQAQQDDLQGQGFEVPTLTGDTFPIEAIVTAVLTEKIDLIVMATHRRRGPARWLLGSVADEVVRLASCPVLLVRQNKKYDPPRRGKLILNDWFGPNLRLNPTFAAREFFSLRLNLSVST